MSKSREDTESEILVTDVIVRETATTMSTTNQVDGIGHETEKGKGKETEIGTGKEIEIGDARAIET